MQGVIFKPPGIIVSRGDLLPVYINGIATCNFKIESFTETEAIGDFTTNVKANLQFKVIEIEEGIRVINIP